ncbi:MAG TPA: carboxypeptidase-like regulatory domain-containing protein, partial [Thermoanaerobaculia bacterium]|nr:carboxypeptidase-like regulatory domain-containing protein [Thermoanaerobaculia bacterium]
MRDPAPICRSILILSLLILLPLSSAFAQSATATLRGTVHDESGNIFPGAEITATNLDRGYRQTTVAGADGNYVLAGLAPGRYRIDVAATMYRGSSKEVSLLVGQTIQADFRLTPEFVVMEQITVVGTTAVEMETHEVATNVTRQQIEQLPQNNRNFMSFAELAPGVIFQDNEFSKRFSSGAG